MTKIVRRAGGNTLFNELAPLFQHGVGFDRIAHLMDAALQETQNQQSNYPPYDIVQTGSDDYTIQMAVAGFSIENLDIKVERNVLTVTGSKPKTEKSGKFLHQGISNRKFNQRFNLTDHIVVRNATLTNGLLTIELVREIPDALKPRTIEIQTAPNLIPEASNEEIVDNLLETSSS
jgi:molecular chaperone IbpA